MTTARLFEDRDGGSVERQANWLRWNAATLEANPARRLELFRRVDEAIAENFQQPSARSAKGPGRLNGLQTSLAASAGRGHSSPAANSFKNDNATAPDREHRN
jgi:hypothetical protein